MTVRAALAQAAARLAGTSDSARLDAELLMAHACGVSRSDLLLRHLNEPEPDAFAAMLARRIGREPVAYIIGEAEFRGLTLIVSPAVLIPRGDSETVVEAALAAKPDARRVLDCGTGSGALLLALLAQWPHAHGVGVDASPDAAQVAQANAKLTGLAERAAIHVRDWTQPGWVDDLGRFDLIVANPPYVETGAELAPDVREFEPHEALFAGPDGLADYALLVPQLANLLAPGGVAVFEIGHAQAPAVSAIAAAAGLSAELRRDLAGRPRALILRRV